VVIMLALEGSVPLVFLTYTLQSLPQVVLLGPDSIL
jgi:hypothetical protein